MLVSPATIIAPLPAALEMHCFQLDLLCELVGSGRRDIWKYISCRRQWRDAGTCKTSFVPQSHDTACNGVVIDLFSSMLRPLDADQRYAKPRLKQLNDYVVTIEFYLRGIEPLLKLFGEKCRRITHEYYYLVGRIVTAFSSNR